MNPVVENGIAICLRDLDKVDFIKCKVAMLNRMLNYKCNQKMAKPAGEAGK